MGWRRIGRAKRRWWVAAAVFAVLAATWLVGGYFVVVHPVTNRLDHVDAIVVLGSPDIDGRQVLAMSLASEGYARVVAISVESERQRELKSACTIKQPRLTVLCFRADPRTTQGEARQIRAYTAEFGWKKIIVVTSSYHISRARVIISRCFGGRVLMAAPKVSHSAGVIAYQYVYQTASYLKAFLITRGC